MWAIRVAGPRRLEQVEVPDLTGRDLDDGQVLLRFVSGGLCGSDTPKFDGIDDPGEELVGRPGVPLHELVGQVVATRSARLEVGSLVVGRVDNYAGLAEYSRSNADCFIDVDPRLDPEVAVTVQPVATVLSALSHLPEPVDHRATVLGLGPLGLLFCHILHHRGYQVTGVDRVDRSSVAAAFGIDELITDDVTRWAPAPSGRRSSGLVVEAVGHSQQLLAEAIRMASIGGHVVAFGLPDKEYVVPMRTLFERHLSLNGGTTRDWQRFLRDGQEYVVAHPELYEVGITNRFHPFDAQAAFLEHSHPRRDRLKVVLVETQETP